MFYQIEVRNILNILKDLESKKTKIPIKERHNLSWAPISEGGEP